MPDVHPRIQHLSDDLINQIAAGEVIERPVSCVKELLENSLDADGQSLEVHLKEGGLSEIHVIDDGHGILKEDIKLSFERHATSKIQSAFDLESIRSYGFRGEALSSMASVAELTIQSRARAQSVGFRFVQAYGITLGEPSPVAIPEGTQIWVRHLFEKIPARRKYLRAANTEFTHISRCIRELALGRPDVRFQLDNDGRRVSSYVGSEPLVRFKECFRVKWEPQRVFVEEEDFRLLAFLSPTHHLQDRGELFLYVNKRAVRNRALLNAVRSVFRDTLGPGHDPSGVLWLDVRYDWVDVNVHPQKTEVRLYFQERLYHWLTAVLRKHISQSRVTSQWVNLPRPIEQKLGAMNPQENRPFFQMPTKAYGDDEPLVLKTADWIVSEPIEQVPFFDLKPVRYFGQMNSVYLLAADEKGMVLFDQHALHEKLLFEKLMASEKRTVENLMVPLVFSLEPHEISIIEQHKDVFSQAGFELEFMGREDVAVKSRPSLLAEVKVEPTLRQSLRWILEEGSVAATFNQMLRPVFATIACHSAVRAGDRLSELEARELLGRLGDLDEGWTCPHGRNVLFRLPFSTIEKYFGRR